MSWALQYMLPYKKRSEGLIMITIQDAVKAAKEFAISLYKEDELKNMRVEEIELASDEGRWLVTLGWVETSVRQLGGLAGLTNASIEPLPRVYKIFTVNSESGNVESMKIRE